MLTDKYNKSYLPESENDTDNFLNVEQSFLRSEEGSEGEKQSLLGAVGEVPTLG